jgi:hypothetical protein
MSTSINDPAAAFSGDASEGPVQEVQVDVTKLNALSPEVISKQATVSQTLRFVSPPDIGNWGWRSIWLTVNLCRSTLVSCLEPGV